MATKLRENFPDIYYMRKNYSTSESSSESTQEETSQDKEDMTDKEDTPNQDLKHQPDEIKQGEAGPDSEAGSSGTERRVEEGNVQPPIYQSDRPTKQDAEFLQIKTHFQKLLIQVGDQRKKIQKFLVRPSNKT